MAKSRKKAPARSRTRKATPARTRARRKSAKKAKKAAKKAGARRPARAATRKSAAKARKTARKAKAKAPAPRRGGRTGATRRPPALDRERRTIREDDVVPTPPSSLNMDRTASPARSGRREFVERLRQHTSTGPAMTGGDVDADWEDAEAVGDEAPGGDNPTPDQDIVDEIGEAIGVTYQDNEPLKGGDEIVERDRHRWELDPASREDYNEED